MIYRPGLFQDGGCGTALLSDFVVPAQFLTVAKGVCGRKAYATMGCGVKS